ncbi:MAG: hypothetical protein NT036_03885, partial [Candidatus Omnitrophica bacterium]|nr:hypothetical protein [Candidatus Omnitrophota bacterium]
MKKILLLAIIGIMILACNNAYAVSPWDPEKIKKGDFNCDGHTNYLDFDILKENFGRTFGSWEESGNKGDANGDYEIGPEDFGILKDNFEFNEQTPSPPITNPEPATMSLLGLGL